MAWHGVDEVLVRAQGAGPDQTSLCPFHTRRFAMPSYILDKATARGLVDKITASLDEIRDAIIQLMGRQGLDHAWLSQLAGPVRGRVPHEIAAPND